MSNSLLTEIVNVGARCKAIFPDLSFTPFFLWQTKHDHQSIGLPQLIQCFYLLYFVYKMFSRYENRWYTGTDPGFFKRLGSDERGRGWTLWPSFVLIWFYNHNDTLSQIYNYFYCYKNVWFLNICISFPFYKAHTS